VFEITQGFNAYEGISLKQINGTAIDKIES